MESLEAYLADAFRWWAAGGAVFASFMVGAALVAVRRTALTAKEGNKVVVALLTIVFFALTAILLAGSMIPFFSDNRVDGWTDESLFYEIAISTAWFLWGIFAWGINLWFARNRMKMGFACLAWFLVCVYSAWATLGASL